MFVTSEKTKYKVSMNWYSELVVKYTYAHSEAQARQQAIKKFSTTVGISFQSCKAYFNRSTDNITIKEVL